jgi:hypothetical protein
MVSRILHKGRSSPYLVDETGEHITLTGRFARIEQARPPDDPRRRKRRRTDVRRPPVLGAWLILAFWATVLLGFAGCASKPPRLDKQITTGHALLLPGSIYVTSWGVDYKLHAVLQLKGRRVGVEAWATDCIRGVGTLRAPGALQDPVSFLSPEYGGSMQFQNLIDDGGEPTDRMFHTLCDQGIPLVEDLETSLSAEDRAKAEAFFNRMKWRAAKKP